MVQQQAQIHEEKGTMSPEIQQRLEQETAVKSTEPARLPPTRVR